MKKLLLWLLPLFLAGCAQPKEFETMADSYEIPELPPAEEVSLLLPTEAAATVMETGDDATIYLCDGYTVAVQTFQGGDLNKTLLAVTGYGRDQLTVMSWQQGELTRHECVWTAAGENGDQVGRTLVLDTGNWHYTLSLMASAEQAGALQTVWQEILESFRLGYEVSEKR